MANQLKRYFPGLWEREDLLAEIQGNRNLLSRYEQLNEKEKEEFISFCMGMLGTKILRDAFFKEVLNPEYTPERLESFLSVLLERRVKIVRILPNDSTRVADEKSLLITDIIVELEDGSLANVEIQKIGYAFPGPRSACYSADMLLRQYKRVRTTQEKQFDYEKIKNVYLIVIYEKSPTEFREYPDIFYHRSKQIFNSGLELNLLQEYIMIPLDIYHKRADNKNIETPLEAWLTFLSDDRPEKIIELITKFPEFKPMYETLYQMCKNVERVMSMFFSEELRIMDNNTVQYMIDEQQKEIDELLKMQETMAGKMEEKDNLIESQGEIIRELQKELDYYKTSEKKCTKSTESK